MVVLSVTPVVPDPSGVTAIDIWSRWDATWYLRVARDGYALTPGEGPLAFFPLYPAVVSLVAAPLGATTASLAFAGILVANVALLVALVLLVRLVRLDFDEATARRTVLYLLVFPTTLFLSAAYAESLFLALAVGAMYAIRTDRPWVAGLLAAAAALTRPHGVLLVAPLAWEYVARRDFSLRRIDRRALSLVLPPAALVAFMAWLAVRFGDPLAAWRAHEAWGRSLVPPWETLARFFSAPLQLHGYDRSLLDLAFAIGYAVLVTATWRLLRPSYALFATLPFAAVLSSGLLTSMTRQGIVLFPVFIVLALAGRRPAFDRAYVAASSVLACVFMALFAAWRWVA